jgi:hypothetical protein
MEHIGDKRLGIKDLNSVLRRNPKVPWAKAEQTQQSLDLWASS